MRRAHYSYALFVNLERPLDSEANRDITAGEGDERRRG